MRVPRLHQHELRGVYQVREYRLFAPVNILEVHSLGENTRVSGTNRSTSSREKSRSVTITCIRICSLTTLKTLYESSRVIPSFSSLVRCQVPLSSGRFDLLR